MIRQAVVVAARTGHGDEVMRQRVAGVPLVTRAIIVAARAGLDRIIVVAEPTLGRELAADPALTGLGPTLVHVAGTLADARAHVDDPFVLVFADQVFDVAVVKAAASVGLEDGQLAIGIDRRGTERGVAVALDGDRVVALDATRDAAGVGAYAAGPALLDQLGSATLDDVVRRTVAAGAAVAFDVGEALWHDASTATALRAAQDALFRSLGKRTDGPVSRWINRPISTFVTRRLVDTNVSPNQMTVVANVIGALGVVLVFQGTWALLALGALLVQLQSILDGCDGELARLKFRSSRLGEWLDNVLDDQVNVGYGIGLGFAAAALTGQAWWRWVGLGAGAAFMVHNLVFYAQLAFVHRTGNPFHFRWWFERPGVDVTAMLANDGLVTRIGGAARALIRRDVFLFAFLGLAVAGLPQVAVSWYAAIAASQFGLIVIHVASGGLSRARAPR